MPQEATGRRRRRRSVLLLLLFGSPTSCAVSLSLRAGDDPCARIWALCDEDEAEDARLGCVHTLRAELFGRKFEASTETWSAASRSFRLGDSYFCGCCARVASFGTERSKESEATLALLREALETQRPEPLAAYNERRLSDPRARARHYGDVVRHLPRNAYAQDALALALRAIGKHVEADGVLRRGLALGLWPSVSQRPSSHTPHLRAQPFWDDFVLVRKERKDFSLSEERRQKRSDAFTRAALADVVKTELLAALLVVRPTPQPEGLVLVGGWDELVLRKHGVDFHRDLFPRTLRALQTFFNVKVSILHPRTAVAPHCGPSNARLRAHLTLADAGTDATITVANETRAWATNHLLVFDDSFEHSVRNDGPTPRIVLILDFWHPDLPLAKRDFTAYGVVGAA